MRNYIIVAAISLVAGATIVKLYWPDIKTVETEIVKTNVVTEVKEVIRKDGTREVVTIIKDNSTKRSTDTKVETAQVKPKWHASVSATRTFQDADLTYGAQVDYNLVGPFSVGIRADTSNQIGLTIGVSF